MLSKIYLLLRRVELEVLLEIIEKIKIKNKMEEFNKKKIEKELNVGKKETWLIKDRTIDFLCVEYQKYATYDISEILRLFQVMRKYGYVFRGIIEYEYYFEKSNLRRER